MGEPDQVPADVEQPDGPDLHALVAEQNRRILAIEDAVTRQAADVTSTLRDLQRRVIALESTSPEAAAQAIDDAGLGG